ncbi:MAG: translation initiation factor IF-2 [Syntrophales bacterium]|jgi:translation initiation factor IF-2|nr:translation initiation factor IF-2 [Syntrophales bacterium]NLN59935.1 translation initiation factor IF-2 [Deltaproteobacteria bacterium]
MAKKRVYEVARELGLENKELISRVEKMGIAVKSHSSTLEDGDVERIIREIRGVDPQEVEEKRITSTIIRRRAVRPSAEEERVETPEKEVPVKGTEIPAGGGEVDVKGTDMETRAEPVILSKPAVKAKKPVEQEVSHEGDSPAAARIKETAVRMPPVPETEEKVMRVDGRKKGGHPGARLGPEAAQIAGPGELTGEEPRGVVSPSAPQFPEKKTEPLRTVKDPVSDGAEKPSQTEAEEDKGRKKKKAPLETRVEEVVPAKKKSFLKKSADKKGRHIEIETEEKSVRWWEEKKIAPIKMKKTQITTPKAIKRRIKIDEAISVGEMAKKMGVKAGDVINKLMKIGIMATINQSIDFDAASLIALEFDYQVEAAGAGHEFEEAILKTRQASKNLKPRGPVVTIMGHVDHGKTSLLDAIRKTNVIDGEAGGITQAIGAYHVRLKGRDIVFLDTPGHEAFTAMRARGAKVTDIVVLVVAADDGVMEQTVEAINHSRVAEVPILVAVNKVDKTGADPGKIKQGLTEHNLIPEEWGGDTIFCEVSAKKQEGIEDLLEMILLQADMLDLKADPDLPARGVIVEAKLDKGRGAVATVLIQEGTLREGDAFVSKTEWGRVRAMYSDQGGRVKEAGPSTPVEVIGFSSVPQASAEFVGVEDEKKARGIAEYWIKKEREKELASTSKITLEQLYQKIREGVKDLNVILKADVQGSIEALGDALTKLSTSDIKLNIIHSSPGTITETDVMLASASNAIIIGFNVRPDTRVVEIAEQEGVDIKLYDIIYNAIADVRAAMEGLLDPEYKEVSQGKAEVRELFRVPKIGTIAGSFVLEGKITRRANARLVRDGVQIFDGKILSLRRFKDDAKEVLSGFECGIGIEGFNDLKPGDIIETYSMEKVERKL